MQKRKRNALRRNARKIIEDAGGRAAVAKHFAISHFAVTKWYGSRIPQDRILPLCDLANTQRGDQYWHAERLLATSPNDGRDLV